MPDMNIPASPSRSLLWIAVGRQRVGKTTLLNAAVQYFGARGCPMQIWNADQQNRTHSLSTFFPDAKVPSDGGIADSKQWIEDQLVDQRRHNYHAVLDAGGGWTGFSTLVHDVPLIDTLSESGTDVIGLFCIGPEQADLDYLEGFADSGSFLPQATVIVLNEGLVLSGRSSRGAFASVVGSSVIQNALRRGAQVVMFPGLSCMAEVTNRGISFAQAAAGQVKPGQAPMSMFDPVRVREWWTKKIPAFFEQFPSEWVPAPNSSLGQVASVATPHPGSPAATQKTKVAS